MSKRLYASFISIAFLLALLPLTTAVAAGEQELYNFQFNDESAQGQYFTFGDAATGEWVNSAGVGHGDDTALKTVHTAGMPYTSSSNAVILTLPEPLPAGGVYRIVAWVYAPSAENPGKSTLTGPGFLMNGNYGGVQGVDKFPPEFGTLPMDEWKQIDVTLPLQEEPVNRLDFRIVINDEPNHPDVWYWDGIEIYQVGELEEVVVPEGDPVITRSKIGTYEDFDYELWSQRTEDAVSMTLTGGGTFTCNWEALNVLFRTGKKLGSKMTYSEYGTITLDYGAEYNVTKGDVNYLCVYGWTEDPMIEFYILESHGSYKPGGTNLKGTYEMDGGTYEVYVDTRVNQPSIQGTKTFEQYFAIRTDKRSEGTISISEHFKEWEKMGLNMTGKMYEVALCVEGYSSGGSANVYNNVLTVGDTVYGTPTVLTPSEEPTEKAAETSEAPATEEVTETPTVAPTDTPTDTPKDDEGGSSNTVMIVLIVLGALLVVGCVIIFVIRASKKKEK